MVKAQNKLPAKIIYGLAASQVIFTVILMAVTAGSLDQGHVCQLNLNPETGRTCDFVYSSSPFIIVFSLALIVVPYLTGRKSTTGPVTSGAGVGLAALGAFWYIVVAVTVTIRGGQATRAGQPGTSARQAVEGLTWIVGLEFLGIAAACIADMWTNRLPRPEEDHLHTFIVGDHSAAYTYTRALGHTPLD